MFWTLRLPCGPECNVAVAVGHKVYCFGTDTDPIDVKVFNTVSLRWAKLPPVTRGGKRPGEVPTPRCHVRQAVLIEDVIYMWGGLMDHSVLYAFDVDAHRWSKPTVSGTVPDAWCGQSACVLGKVMYIHGGQTQLTRYTDDIYKLDTTTMVWDLINARGISSAWHSATIIGTKMLVFGGRGLLKYNDSIRVFDTESNCWLGRTPFPPFRLPGERWCHSAFAYSGELYIFHQTVRQIDGGWTVSFEKTQTLNDLWKFHPATCSWGKVQPKGEAPSQTERWWYRRTPCCMVGDRIIFFGGYTPKGLYIVDMRPSLKTLCELAVIQNGLEQSELSHNIRRELTAMTNVSHRESPSWMKSLSSYFGYFRKK